MARIPIFNNLDVGQYTNQTDIVSANLVARTSPIRLFSFEGAIQNISYEILMTNNAATWAFRFYQEFYSDHPHMGGDTPSARGNDENFNPQWPYPIYRDFPKALMTGTISQDLTWAREQSAVVNNDGTIDHFDATRRTTLTSDQAKWFPMEVHSYWVRLAVWGTTDMVHHRDGQGQLVEATTGQLRIWAHVGGHAESRYLQEQTEPYNYSHSIA